jgi:hypothetical protein
MGIKGKPMKHSNFRRWVQEMWYRHEDECEAYRDFAKSPTEYWNTYKWWLKREFRFQQNK